MAFTAPGSFRDPGGFVFSRGDILYRQINAGAQDAYEHLMQSGLYALLSGDGRLIPHEPAGFKERFSDEAVAVIRPERVPFVSYPYEWCFGQLKDAALLTLDVQKEALGFGMSLKDASAYNVQFREGCRPVFIDTLSFERYTEGRPWVAYRQFCQHFLAPLALMAHVDVRLGRLLPASLDGIALDLAAKLLPTVARLDLTLLTHLYLHNSAQKRWADTTGASASRAETPDTRRTMSRNALCGLLDSLEAGIRRLAWRPEGTEWSDYYENTSYDDEALSAKKQIIAGLLARIYPAPRRVCDLGANTGLFSRIASAQNIFTLALDVDMAAVEKNYRACKGSGERHLLPLVQELTNPSPGVGWAGEERPSFLARWGAPGPPGDDASPDVAFALALVHHLAVSNNIPLANIADLLSGVADYLIIEWVPREDPQVQRLLARREEGVFPGYTGAGFESAFGARFTILGRAPVPGTRRTLYLMRRRNAA